MKKNLMDVMPKLRNKALINYAKCLINPDNFTKVTEAELALFDREKLWELMNKIFDTDEGLMRIRLAIRLTQLADVLNGVPDYSDKVLEGQREQNADFDLSEYPS